MEKRENYKVANDTTLQIATANKRTAKQWSNKQILWSDLVNLLSDTTRTNETVLEYTKMPKADKDNRKDVGGFVGGLLKAGRRKKENVQNRTLVTLDLDSISEQKETVQSVWDSITMMYENELLIYSTHSHTNEKPRLRLIIPLAKPISNDMYEAVSRKIAQEIGIDMFDDTTYEASRLMYFPSTPKDGEFIFKYQSGNLLKGEAVLDQYFDWKDASEYPTSKRERDRINRLRKKQENPKEKQGLIGAFCRTYSITEAISEFLPDVYKETGQDDRYSYALGSTTGGLVVYEDAFAYSHHGTDPISGELCNSFDLVRIHLFGDLDADIEPGTRITSYPSYKKMIEFTQDDSNVKVTLVKEKAESLDDFEFDQVEKVSDGSNNLWIEKLTVNKKGEIINTINNAVLIMENDPRLKGKFIYDSFANRASVDKGIPWTKTDKHDWSDNDDSGLRNYLEKLYGITTISKIDDAKNIVFERNKVHPVRDYLESLMWDGVKRIETLFIDYLGAEDDIYTREVATIHLVGAVSRVFRPGCKFDTMVTIAGRQGIGKSTFIAKLAKSWYSDSLDTMKGKEAAELIQGVWHIELGELNATRKADRDMVKSFLSKRDDIYRVAYAKNTSRFPRQCVFWGTTNESDFLRDPTGDRRTYPIDCEVVKPKYSIFKDLTEEVVDQLWAEAKVLFDKGQQIYLTGEAYKLSIEKQKAHKEDNPLRGHIEEYLERLYPANWDEMTLSERKSYITGDEDTFLEADLIYKKDRVCVLEIWCELLGKRPGDLKPINSREINDILRSLEGWEMASTARFGSLYGTQRGYLRKEIL